MSKSRLDLTHIIASALLLKANAEIIKCVDNGHDTTLRLRTDNEMIEVKVKTYGFEE